MHIIPKNTGSCNLVSGLFCTGKIKCTPITAFWRAAMEDLFLIAGHMVPVEPLGFLTAQMMAEVCKTPKIPYRMDSGKKKK